MQYLLIGLLIMSAPWDYSIHFTRDFHTNLLKKLVKHASCVNSSDATKHKCKKGFKLKKKTLTTDVWSELDGRKLHPPFGSDEPPLSFGQGWVKNFLGLAQDILGCVNIFLGWLKRLFWLVQYFFGLA